MRGGGAIDQTAIERIVRHGGYLLAEALDWHWPTNGNNEVGESNITLHLARAFAEQGFQVYAEGHSDDGTETRLDLLALHLGSGVQVAVEAKRLYNASQAKAMHADVERVSRFRVSNQGLLHGDLPRLLFGVVVATTWSAEYAQWFSRKDADHPTSSTSIWAEFADDKRLKDAAWGSVVLRGYDGRRADVDFHHMVYSVFEIQT